MKDLAAKCALIAKGGVHFMQDFCLEARLDKHTIDNETSHPVDRSKLYWYIIYMNVAALSAARQRAIKVT